MSCGDGDKDATDSTPSLYSIPCTLPGPVCNPEHPVDGGDLLTFEYRGGRLIEHPKIVHVLYGTGTYQSGITGTGPNTLSNFFRQVVQTSGVDDWLQSEYDEAPYVLGRGGFLGEFTVTPGFGGASWSGIALTLSTAFTAGTLPQPDDNTIYSINFPQGVTVGDPFGGSSCTPTGFCSYHYMFTYNAHEVVVEVHPDTTASGCSAVCPAGTPFQVATQASYHELVEAITDPQAGVNNQIGWFRASTAPQDELADPCSSLATTFTGTDNTTFTIQQIWDNAALTCQVPHLRSAQDIGYRDSAGNVAFWVMNGNVIQHTSAIATPGAGWALKTVGDFNGDGTTDILWRNTTTSALQVWELGQNSGTNAGEYVQLANPTSPSTPIPTLQVQGTGDFDGDGTTDVLWRDSSTGQVQIWFFHNGVDTTQVNVGAAVSSDWTIRGVGDFNNDGKSDIEWRHDCSTCAGEEKIWLLNGSTIASQPQSTTVLGLTWTIAGVGDFNRDGTSDLLWRNTSTNEIKVWLMSNGLDTAQTTVATAPTGASIRELGDFNNDGKTDVLWETAGGSTSIWFMNGATRTTSNVVDGTGNTPLLISATIFGAGTYNF